MTEERWPGEERLVGTRQEELGPEVPADEVELGPGEEELAESDGRPQSEPTPQAEAEPALPEEQVEEGDDAAGDREDDTPPPDQAPAEEDELPRLRPPGPHGALHRGPRAAPGLASAMSSRTNPRCCSATERLRSRRASRRFGGAPSRIRDAQRPSHKARFRG